MYRGRPASSTSRKLSNSFNAVRICVWVRPAVVLLHGAIGRCTELFLPLQRFAGTPNSCSNSKLAFQAVPVQIRVWIRPAVVWSPWATLPLKMHRAISVSSALCTTPNSCSNSKLAFQFSPVRIRFWLRVSSCRMVALSDAVPLEMHRVHPASS